MSNVLAFDTSNYTTSACVINTIDGLVWENRNMIPVEMGKCGVRQSDAVFHHIRNLNSLFDSFLSVKIDCVCASDRPSERENSYMPCFTVGVSFAKTIASLMGCGMYTYSHQKGHIMAAAVSGGCTQILRDKFLAYHVSGGTTDVLLCTPCGKNFTVEKVGGTADISCGQPIDRTGPVIGLPFPSGKYIEQKSTGNIDGKIKIVHNNGLYNFSGFQNKVDDMKKSSSPDSEICDYVINVIYSFLTASVTEYRNIYGDIPVIMSGGVMSNKIISAAVRNQHNNVFFADPKYSVDNALGTAYLCAAEKGSFNA